MNNNEFNNNIYPSSNQNIGNGYTPQPTQPQQTANYQQVGQPTQPQQTVNYQQVGQPTQPQQTVNYQQVQQPTQPQMGPTKKICPHCGNQVDANAETCFMCGNKF